MKDKLDLKAKEQAESSVVSGDCLHEVDLEAMPKWGSRGHVAPNWKQL